MIETNIDNDDWYDDIDIINVWWSIVIEYEENDISIDII